VVLLDMWTATYTVSWAKAELTTYSGWRQLVDDLSSPFLMVAEKNTFIKRE
jgi:hypothetical protein